jgi:hypothetical protein
MARLSASESFAANPPAKESFAANPPANASSSVDSADRTS